MTTPDKEEMPTDRTEGQFRKKPVVVDAVQLRQRFLWPDWFHDAVSSNVIITHGLGKYGTGPVYCEIKTLEGVMRANAGDWVVRGTQGEIYPCKPDIFIEIYEPVGIATAFNAYEPMREALAAARDAIASLDKPALGYESAGDGSAYWPVQSVLLNQIDAALSTLPVNDRQTSDDVGILRALLEEELVWHEERDKSLSKQPQSNQVVWRRAEHQERIDVIRAALKGVPQPASEVRTEVTLQDRLRYGVPQATHTERRRAELQAASSLDDLTDTIREIEKQCTQADDPEHHTLSLVKHMSRNALARLSQPASEAGKLSTDEVR